MLCRCTSKFWVDVNVIVWYVLKKVVVVNKGQFKNHIENQRIEEGYHTALSSLIKVLGMRSYSAYKQLYIAIAVKSLIKTRSSFIWNTSKLYTWNFHLI